jgi:hypothetical protein
MTDETPPCPDRWLLLIHQLPAKPAYFRVKIWRRLQALGAVPSRTPSMPGLSRHWGIMMNAIRLVGYVIGWGFAD